MPVFESNRSVVWVLELCNILLLGEDIICWWTVCLSGRDRDIFIFIRTTSLSKHITLKERPEIITFKHYLSASVSVSMSKKILVYHVIMELDFLKPEDSQLGMMKV